MVIEKSISALTAASVIAALGQLGLPTTEEVRLITDIINSQGSFDKMPTFLKKRRGTSRAITIWDFVRPVETTVEHSLFLECFATLTTNQRKLDWLAFTREVNVRDCRIWEATKMISNLYLKDHMHMQEHQNHIVLQASQAEVNKFCNHWLASISIITVQRAFTASTTWLH